MHFESLKLRGGGTDSVAYAYSVQHDISYEERLASVRLVDPEQIEEFQRIETAQNDAVVIAAVEALIAGGTVKKMELAKAAAAKADVSVRVAVKVLDAYTGPDPEQHRWHYSVKDRGAKVFTLHPPHE